MGKKMLVVIDNDQNFIKSFKARLTYIKLSEKYEVKVIDFDQYDKTNILSNTMVEFKMIVDSGAYIAAVFVDINLVDNRVEYDSSGIVLASKLKKAHPLIPIYNVTGKISFNEQLDVYSDATQEINDGVLTKYYLSEGGFDEARLERLESRRTCSSFSPETNLEMMKVETPPAQEVDIAFLTAMFDDEFESISSLVNWTYNIKDSTKVLHLGTINITRGERIDKTIQIVATHQLETGMVDAAVLATEIVTKYKPRYLIMTGVCGGKDDDDMQLGDIAVAKKVFTFQKGKFTEDGFEHEGEECKIDGKLIQQIVEKKKEIARKIMDADTSRASIYKRRPLGIYVEPMACSTAVLNRAGIFRDAINVGAAERKVIAVDMESYGVARACELANEGNSKAIIVKSVMDKTVEKNDDAKSFAGFTSAQFIKVLIEDVLFQ